MSPLIRKVENENVIIGYSGSGKSTLAKGYLACKLPKLHMDTLQFQPGWQDSDREWMLTRNEKLSHKARSLGHRRFFGVAMKKILESDQIIFLNFSLWTCLFRALQTVSHLPRQGQKVWQQAV